MSAVFCCHVLMPRIQCLAGNEEDSGIPEVWFILKSDVLKKFRLLSKLIGVELEHKGSNNQATKRNSNAGGL